MKTWHALWLAGALVGRPAWAEDGGFDPSAWIDRADRVLGLRDRQEERMASILTAARSEASEVRDRLRAAMVALARARATGDREAAARAGAEASALRASLVGVREETLRRLEGVLGCRQRKTLDALRARS